MNESFRRRRMTRRALLPPLLGALGGLLLLVPLCLMIGPEPISPGALLSAFGSSSDSGVATILFELRLPRVLLALGVGAALSASGATFQALLKNPLAEPYILGVSNGCAIGAILAFWLGLGQAGVTGLSFLGGAIVVAIVLRIGGRRLDVSSEGMLLGGVMVAAVGAALIFLFLYMLGSQARMALQWMLGDLSGATQGIGAASILLFAGILGVCLVAGNLLNALALGEEQAATLGVNVRVAGIGAYLLSSFVVGVTVSFCGAIGFVGLVVPHIVRRLVGPDHRIMLPLAAIGGSAFVLLCDTVARSLVPLASGGGGELPVGAVTALVGAPLFIHLLRRGG